MGEIRSDDSLILRAMMMMSRCSCLLRSEESKTRSKLIILEAVWSAMKLGYNMTFDPRSSQLNLRVYGVSSREKLAFLAARFIHIWALPRAWRNLRRNSISRLHGKSTFSALNLFQTRVIDYPRLEWFVLPWDKELNARASHLLSCLG